jgi:hypothetical protein
VTNSTVMYGVNTVKKKFVCFDGHFSKSVPWTGDQPLFQRYQDKRIKVVQDVTTCRLINSQ